MTRMSTAVEYPHVEKLAGSPACLRRVPRVRVAQIAMDYIAHGWSADEMCRQHPYLMPAEAHAAMAYYFDHQEEIDQEIQGEWEQLTSADAATRRSAFCLRMRAKRAI